MYTLNLSLVLIYYILSANHPYLQPEGWIAKGAAQRDRLNACEGRLWQPPSSHEWSRSTAAKPDVFLTRIVRIVCGFFNVPQLFATRVLRRDLRLVVLESLTICWCSYKGSTFYSVILRPWMLVRTHDLPHDNPMLSQLSHRCAFCFFIIQTFVGTSCCKILVYTLRTTSGMFFPLHDWVEIVFRDFFIFPALSDSCPAIVVRRLFVCTWYMLPL